MEYLWQYSIYQAFWVKDIIMQHKALQQATERRKNMYTTIFKWNVEMSYNEIFNNIKQPLSFTQMESLKVNLNVTKHLKLLTYVKLLKKKKKSTCFINAWENKKVMAIWNLHNNHNGWKLIQYNTFSMADG